MATPRAGASFKQGYVPELADVVHLDWAPALGHEMTGSHYGLVLSATVFNHATGLVVVAPITSKRGKVGSFDLEVRAGRVSGVALISGLRSLDYTTRNIQFESRAPAAVVAEANRRIAMFLPA